MLLNPNNHSNLQPLHSYGEYRNLDVFESCQFLGLLLQLLLRTAILLGGEVRGKPAVLLLADRFHTLFDFLF